MPRETIPADSPDADTHLLVSWTPSLQVQVGVEYVQGEGVLRMLYGADTDHLGHAARAVEAVVLDYQKQTGGSYEELGSLILSAFEDNYGIYSSLWVPGLDRPGVNKLIRVLRRSRDAVFGKDE